MTHRPAGLEAIILYKLIKAGLGTRLIEVVTLSPS